MPILLIDSFEELFQDVLHGKAWYFCISYPNHPAQTLLIDNFVICEEIETTTKTRIKHRQLRARRALSLYKVNGNSALLVLNGTSLHGNNALLALN